MSWLMFVVVAWFVWLCYGVCGAPLMSNPTFWASLRCQVVSWITRISPGFGRFDTFMRRDIYRHNRNKSQYIPYLPYHLHKVAVSPSWDEIFRIFWICAILPVVDEWRYILSLVICSIIQHWWLILIVGGWLIVAMLQYVMAAHTDPSPATSAPTLPPSFQSSHLFLLFLIIIHNILTRGGECAPQCPCVLCALYAPIFLNCPKFADVMLAVAFLFSESSPLKHKSSRQQRERRTGGHSR